MKNINKQIRNLTETANNLNELLGAGGGFGQQQPSTLSTAPPRNPFDFPSRPTLSGNTTQGLYRSGGGSWTFFDGVPVTEAWQEAWDKWIYSGADSGVEMPWPPQFQGMFENNDAFTNPNDPNSGWVYWNSVFLWLFGSHPHNWGNGALQQLRQAGIIDLGNPPSPNWWGYIYGALCGPPCGGQVGPNVGYVFIQLLFGATGTPQYYQAISQFMSWQGSDEWGVLWWLWHALNGALHDINGDLINQPQW